MTASSLETIIKPFVDRIDIAENRFPDDTEEAVEEVLRGIATTGELPLDWKKYILPIVAFKLNKELEVFNGYKGFHSPSYDTFENRKAEIFKLLQSFDYPPFTVQRLIELILHPTSCYQSTHKFMNSVVKLLSVTS